MSKDIVKSLILLLVAVLPSLSRGQNPRSSTSGAQDEKPVLIETRASNCSLLFTSAVEKSKGNLATLLVEEGDAQAKPLAGRTGVLRAQSLNLSLLHARLPFLSFDQVTKVNPTLVLNQILRSDALDTLAEKKGFEIPLRPSGPVISPAASSTQMPDVPAGKSFEDIALDVAARFHGVVLYRECSTQAGKKIVTVDFFR